MGFWTGFLQRGGERAHEENMLDIQNKIEKHKGFLEMMQKEADDPRNLPERQEAARQKMINAQQLGPMKMKPKDFDISDLVTVKSPSLTSAPGPPRTEGGAPDAMRPIMYSPSRLQGEPELSRSGRWSIPEQAALTAEAEAEKQRRMYEETIAYRKQLVRGGANPLDLKGQYTGRALKELNAVNSENLDDDTIYNAGQRRLTGEWEVSPEVAIKYAAGGVGRTAEGGYTYTRRNPYTGATEEAPNPDQVQPFVPTRTNTVPIVTDDGEQRFYNYAVDSMGNPVLNPDGSVNLSPIATPSGYLPRTNVSTVIRDTGTSLEPFQLPSTSTPAAPTSAITFNSKGQPTLNGHPIRIMNQPAGPKQPAPQLTEPPAAITPPPGSEQPPMAQPGVTTPAATPMGAAQPGAMTQQPLMQPQPRVQTRDSLGAALGRVPDPYFEKRVDVNKTNALVAPNYIPEPVTFDPKLDVIRRAYPEDKEIGSVRRTPGGGVYKNQPALTSQQYEKVVNSANVMGTTATLLSGLLDEKSIGALNSLSNRVRMYFATSDDPWYQFASSTLSKIDPFITQDQLKVLDDFSAIKRNLKEHIQVMRTPLGAAGFRSLEAFFSLQAQAGDLLARPTITKQVMENSLKTILTIQAAYRYSRYRSDKSIGYNVNNTPDKETKTQYLLAYGMDQAAALAALQRDGYTVR